MENHLKEQSKKTKKIKDRIEKYAQDIQNKWGNGRELDYRTPLENLLNDCIHILEYQDTLTLVHEPRMSDFGYSTAKTPDFVLHTQDANKSKKLLRIIEAKDVLVDIYDTLKSEQLKYYSQYSREILITNYRSFLYVEYGQSEPNIRHKIEILNTQGQILENKDLGSDWMHLLEDLFPQSETDDTRVLSYTSIEQVAKILAKQTRTLETEMLAYVQQHYSKSNSKSNSKDDSFTKRIIGAREEYKKILGLEELKLEDFIGTYAQSFLFGIVIAKLLYEKRSGAPLQLEENKKYLHQIYEEFHQHHSMLYEFLEKCLDPLKIPDSLVPVFGNLARQLNALVFQDILERHELTHEDLMLYLYQDYLKEYDALAKKAKGVYYTPQEVVDFIIRSTEYALKEILGYEKGFLDDQVKVLDFATGTGHFLLSLYQQVIAGNTNGNEGKSTIRKKIHRDFIGFEMMMVPYLLAQHHLKYVLATENIDQTPEQSKEALPIYLTNSLDLREDSIANLFPEMAANFRKAQEIKLAKNIIAIVGNPPYNARSKEKGNGIKKLIEEYKIGLGEKTINALHDDYVKFIAMAEKKIQDAGHGVLGIITNNTFLEGSIFRLMRLHLMETFDEIYFINLHGNARKKEKDKNVFDIQVGTVISLMVKKQSPREENPEQKPSLAQVHYLSILDEKAYSREEKLDYLAKHHFPDLPFKTLQPQAPKYYFIPKKLSGQDKYELFWPIVQKNKKQKAGIFENYNVGIQSARDRFTMYFTQKALERMREQVQGLNVDKVRIDYEVGEDQRDWDLGAALEDLKTNYNPQRILYRPFDHRWTSLSRGSHLFLAFPSYEIMQHLEKKEGREKNTALIVSRRSQYKGSMSLLSHHPLDRHTLGETDTCIPLFVWENREKGVFADEKAERVENFSRSFQEYRQSWGFQTSAEGILHYIYAVLYHPLYKKRYANFLDEFPRIPFTASEEVFRQYEALGKELSVLHLMDKIPEGGHIDFDEQAARVLGKCGEKGFVLAKIHYDAKNGELHLTSVEKEKITFLGIEPEIWEYNVGSYPVIAKWLKARKVSKGASSKAGKPALMMDDIREIVKIAKILKATLDIEKELAELPLPEQSASRSP